MTLEERVEYLEFKVKFPMEKGVSICFGDGHAMSFTQRIGSEVLLKIGSGTLATIAYSEEFSSEFVLKDYEHRAISHAKTVIGKIANAAQIQTAKYQAAMGMVVN